MRKDQVAKMHLKSAPKGGGENLCSFFRSPPIAQPFSRGREIKKSGFAGLTGWPSN
jgi:hypothetical protein